MWDRTIDQSEPSVIFQLIYTCALAPSVTSADLALIAETSAARNRLNGVTGVLLCQDGSAMQVLEGVEPVIEAIYDRIRHDERVSHSLVLLRRKTDQREFPNWSMGFRQAEPSDRTFDLSPQSFSAAIPPELSIETKTLSRTFARVNGLAYA